MGCTDFAELLTSSSYQNIEPRLRSKFWRKQLADKNHHQWFIHEKSNNTYNEQVVLVYIPAECVGHEGIAHGGFLATILDESFCYCAYSVLPHETGVTASLSINYRSPIPSNTWMMIHSVAESVPDSRKATITGSIYSESSIDLALKSSQLPWQFQAPVSVEATQIVVEPKWHDKLNHR